MILFLFLFNFSLYASDRPNKNTLDSDSVIAEFKERNKEVPGDRVLPDIEIKNPLILKRIHEAANTVIKFKDKIIKPKNEEVQSADIIIEKPLEVNASSVVTLKLKENIRKKNTKNQNVKKESLVEKTEIVESQSEIIGSGVQFFFTESVEVKSKKEEDFISLPSGSTAQGILLGGVEVSTASKDIDARLEFSFLGPNKTVVELTGCVIWITMKGNYNTERIYGEGNLISCRSQNGETFEIPFLGYVKDETDEYLGLKADLLTRGKAAAAALSFLSNGAKSFGEAIAAAQVKTDIVSGNANGGPLQASNIGDDSKYIIGKTSAGASSDFLDWWVQYYKSLEPTLAIPSGKKFFVSIKHAVKIPSKFFKNGKASNIIKNAIKTNIVSGG